VAVRTGRGVGSAIEQGDRLHVDVFRSRSRPAARAIAALHAADHGARISASALAPGGLAGTSGGEVDDRGGAAGPTGAAIAAGRRTARAGSCSRGGSSWLRTE
jgi:hypothetical protein